MTRNELLIRLATDLTAWPAGTDVLWPRYVGAEGWAESVGMLLKRGEGPITESDWAQCRGVLAARREWDQAMEESEALDALARHFDWPEYADVLGQVRVEDLNEAGFEREQLLGLNHICREDWRVRRNEVRGMTAAEILRAGLGHMEDRATTYDKPQGERSMGKTAAMFQALYGEQLEGGEFSEEMGWAFMVLLKLVRTSQGDFRADNYEDGAAYFGLMGEAASKEPRG